MRNRIGQIYHAIVKFLQSQYGDTKLGVSWFFMLIISLITALIISENMGSIGGTTSVVLIFIILFGVLWIGKVVVHILQKVVCHYSLWNFLCIVGLGVIIYEVFREGLTPSNLSWQPMVVIVLVQCIFARCLYALIWNKKRNVFVIVPFILTLGADVIFGYVLFTEGYEPAYVEQYLNLNSELKTGGEKVIQYETKYDVKSFSYGVNEQEVTTKTVDMSPFMQSYTGINQKLRDWYWGYGVDEIPLEGKVWYPEDAGKCPLFFIVHGNADMTTQSYLGYEYLGEYLAKVGYIVVSVNETWCNYFMGNGFSDENDARAILLLENIKEVLSWNTEKGNPLYNGIQADAISIAGHSRGGEAVALAAAFNQLSHYPDDGTITFDYNFPIETVIAIAPTSEQYLPSERKVVVEDVNYFLVQGSNDQDVSSFMGLNQYEQVEFSSNSGKQKAYLYIVGANHGQFNTEWGRYDSDFPSSLVLNVKPIIGGEEQRSILEQYIKICLDVTIKGDTTNQDFLWNIEAYGRNLPETIFAQGYQEASFEAIADFEEDMDLITACGDTVISTHHLTKWYETKKNTQQDYNAHNYAVYFEWKDKRDASYKLIFSEKNMEGKILSFDIMNASIQDTADKMVKKLDFSIQLTDKMGNTSNVLVSDYKTIYPPFKIVYSKIVKLFNRVTFKKQFQTVRIPMEAFLKSNEQIDLEQITSITFSFNRKRNGAVMLDNIGCVT